MSSSYRVQEQDDGSYIVRFGWRALAYRLSAEEFGKYRRLVHFFILMTITAVVPIIFVLALFTFVRIFDRPSLANVFIFVLVVGSILECLYDHHRVQESV